MDLPERMHQKITSRLGNNRLIYEPYTFDQIEKILLQRIADIKSIVDKRGLKFIAKKVSMYSGDIRRSLQITGRAFEIAKEQWQKTLQSDPEAKLVTVAFKHAMEAFNELFSSKTVQVLRCLM